MHTIDKYKFSDRMISESNYYKSSHLSIAFIYHRERYSNGLWSVYSTIFTVSKFDGEGTLPQTNFQHFKIIMFYHCDKDFSINL
jgi:hypothetical protein